MAKLYQIFTPLQIEIIAVAIIYKYPHKTLSKICKNRRKK